MSVDVQNVSPAGQHQLPLHCGIEILAGIDQRPGRALAQQLQPLEVVAQDRIFHPDELKTFLSYRLEFDSGFLGPPGLVGVDHDESTGPHGLGQEPQPGEVAVEVWVADLHLESPIADRIGVAEEGFEFAVAQVIVQPRGIDPQAIATAAEELVKWQTGLLGCEIPNGHLHRFVKRQGIGALVAAARTVDAMYQRHRRLLGQGGPRLLLEHADDFLLAR